MIKRLKICDFKSIRNLELSLDPVTILIGRSGTGKSNLVESLRFLRDFLLRPNDAVIWEGGWQRIMPVGEKSQIASFEVEFAVPGEDSSFIYSISFGGKVQHGNTPFVYSERLTIGEEIIFSRTFSESAGGRPVGWKWEKKPNVADLSASQNVPLLGTLPSMHKVVLAFAALSTGIGFYDFPSSTLTPPRNADPKEQLFKNIPGLADNASNYREIIRSITQDFHKPHLRKNLLASLKGVNPSVVSVELDSLTNPQRAIVAHKGDNIIFELALEQESDGFRRFYAHLLALYQTPSKLTLIFEEPENAIFPGALSLLASEFQAAPREMRGQVILTTHSPILLDHFDVENVRVVRMKDGQTVVGPVSKEQRDAVREHLLTTGELLTTDESRTDTPMPAEATG